MIQGMVSGRHALVGLFVRGPDGTEREIEFLIDTGFAGFLTLPRAAVTMLGLPFDHDVPVYLADGNQVLLEAYIGTVLWNDEEQEVEVLATDSEPLLGTALMDGYALNIEFADGGLVVIDPL